jgi:hypothetical protein
MMVGSIFLRQGVRHGPAHASRTPEQKAEADAALPSFFYFEVLASRLCDFADVRCDS